MHQPAQSFVFSLLVSALLSASILSGCGATPTPVDVVAPDGTREYSFVFLVEGERAGTLTPAEQRDAIVGHRANIERLGEEGVLLVAGPFGEPREDPRWSGIFIFDTPDLDQALEWTATDPAVVAGVFAMEPLPWSTTADLRRARALERARKDADEDFVGRAYVLGTATPADAAREALLPLEARGLIPFAGELGAERAGQWLFVIAADTPAEASAMLATSSGAKDVAWRLSSMYATDLLMEIAGER